MGGQLRVVGHYPLEAGAAFPYDRVELRALGVLQVAAGASLAGLAQLDLGDQTRLVLDGAEIYQFNCPLVIDGGATLEIAGGGGVRVAGDLSVLDSSTVVVGTANRSAQVDGAWAGVGGTIEAANVTVDATSRIHADGLGYTGTDTAGSGPGGGAGDRSSGHGGGGGGHGNAGSGGRNSYAGGVAYGLPLEPAEPGSAGGAGYVGVGGAGGGAIRLVVGSSLPARRADFDGRRGGRHRRQRLRGRRGGRIGVDHHGVAGRLRAGDGQRRRGRGVQLPRRRGCRRPGCDLLPGCDGVHRLGGLQGGGWQWRQRFRGGRARHAEPARRGRRGRPVAGGRSFAVKAGEAFAYDRVEVRALGVLEVEAGASLAGLAQLDLGDQTRLVLDGAEVYQFNCPLVIDGGAALEIAGGGGIRVAGDFSVLDSSTVVVGTANRSAQVDGAWAGVGGTIEAANVTVDATSRIHADGLGYTGTDGAGSGPGGGAGDRSSGHGGGGGGHGNAGSGGGNSSTPAGWPTGCRWNRPSPARRAGLAMLASAERAAGRSGVVVSSVLQLDGRISTDGAAGGTDANGSAGGGAGGSVWITTGRWRAPDG